MGIRGHSVGASVEQEPSGRRAETTVGLRRIPGAEPTQAALASSPGFAVRHRSRAVMPVPGAFAGADRLGAVSMCRAPASNT